MCGSISEAPKPTNVEKLPAIPNSISHVLWNSISLCWPLEILSLQPCLTTSEQGCMQPAISSQAQWQPSSAAGGKQTRGEEGGPSSFPPSPPPAPEARNALALHLPRLLWVGAPILQSGVFPLHFAGTQRTCNKPHSGCVSPRQCQYMQKHREAFFKAARFMTSHTAAIFQKHLLKNVTSYLNLSTDCIWILICFRNRKRWKLSHPAGSNAEGWTERNRGVPRKTEGTTKKGEK